MSSFVYCLLFSSVCFTHHLLCLLSRKKKDELKHVVASVKRDSSDLSTVEAQLGEYRYVTSGLIVGTPCTHSFFIRKQLNKKRAHLEGKGWLWYGGVVTSKGSTALEQQVLDVCGTSEYKEKLKEVEEELSSTQE